MATCFVVPDDSMGVRMRTSATPIRLGPTGIVETVAPDLSVGEQVALENALLL